VNARSVDEADTALAAQVWDSPDVSFIHPLGHEHGFDQAPDARDILKTEAESRDVAVHIYGNSAWVEFDRDFVAKFRKDRSPITTHGRETQVYWKMSDGWRLVHVH
jgi:SnoaL-like domain